MELTRGPIKGALKICIYGPEGIGKSTFAAHFPDAVFIDTEGSTKHMDVTRTARPTSWTMLLQQIAYFNLHPETLKTMVIDTADWAEALCIAEICAKHQKQSIEDFGYGKGYTMLAEEFGRLLNRLEELVGKGVNIVFTAHAQMRKFEQPDESSSYDRWELKLQKKTSPLLKEWCDLVLFANYKTFVIKNDDKKAKAVGGKRVMYASHHPCWDAKNRQDLPDELPFAYGEIAHLFADNAPSAARLKPSKEPSATPENEPASAPAPSTQAPVPAPEPARQSPPLLSPDIPFDDYSDVPKALADLMMAENVSVSDVQKAVSYKGYYPIDTPIGNYDPDFISGVLIGAWDQVYKIIQAVKEDKPF